SPPFGVCRWFLANKRWQALLFRCRLHDGRVFSIAPFGPAAIVVAYVFAAHQLDHERQHRRPAARLAVRYRRFRGIDARVLEQLRQVLRALETAGLLVEGVAPLQVDGPWDGTVALRLRVGAAKLTGRASVEEPRRFVLEAFQELGLRRQPPCLG